MRVGAGAGVVGAGLFDGYVCPFFCPAEGEFGC